MIVAFFTFFLILQLSLYNPVIMFLIYKMSKSLFTLLFGYKRKVETDHRTKNFRDFIEQQNFSVYDEMKIEIIFDSKGYWLAFALKDDT